MKIIGKGGSGEFIVTASERELANVAGFYWEGEDGCPRLEAGSVINVGAMYSRLTAIKRAERQFREAQETLRAVADLMDPIQPMIEAANEETTA